MAIFTRVEQEILDKLNADLPSSVYKFSTPSLAYMMAELGEFYPAVHVIYNGYTLPENIARGSAVVYRQNWQVVVITNNVRQMRSGAYARQESGEIIDVVLNALNGLPLQDPFTSLRPSGAQNYESRTGLIFYAFGYNADYPLVTTNL